MKKSVFTIVVACIASSNAGAVILDMERAALKDLYDANKAQFQILPNWVAAFRDGKPIGIRRGEVIPEGLVINKQGVFQNGDGVDEMDLSPTNLRKHLKKHNKQTLGLTKLPNLFSSNTNKLMFLDKLNLSGNLINLDASNQSFHNALTLTHVDLSNNRGTNSNCDPNKSGIRGNIAEALAESRNLIELKLNGNCFTGNFFPSAKTFLIPAQDLAYLDVSDNLITNFSEGSKYNFTQYFRQLKYQLLKAVPSPVKFIDLSCNKVGQNSTATIHPDVKQIPFTSGGKFIFSREKGRCPLDEQQNVFSDSTINVFKNANFIFNSPDKHPNRRAPAVAVNGKCLTNTPTFAAIANDNLTNDNPSCSVGTATAKTYNAKDKKWEWYCKGNGVSGSKNATCYSGAVSTNVTSPSQITKAKACNNTNELKRENFGFKSIEKVSKNYSGKLCKKGYILAEIGSEVGADKIYFKKMYGKDYKGEIVGFEYYCGKDISVGVNNEFQAVKCDPLEQ